MDVAFGVVLVAGLLGAVFGLAWLADEVWWRWDAWQARRRRRCQVRRVSAWRDEVEEDAALRAMDRARREADRETPKADRREGTL